MMTREEAIRHIMDVIAENNAIKPNTVTFEQEKEALYMAIEALKAESHKGDLISRKWLLGLYGDYIGDDGESKYHVPLEVVRQNIKDAPSAEAVQGEWMNVGVLTVRCSNCKSEFHELEAMNFCPNCGTMMK